MNGLIVLLLLCGAGLALLLLLGGGLVLLIKLGVIGSYALRPPEPVEEGDYDLEQSHPVDE
jgi:hypothetical protein